MTSDDFWTEFCETGDPVSYLLYKWRLEDKN
jgi:hypothetical protein